MLHKIKFKCPAEKKKKKMFTFAYNSALFTSDLLMHFTTTNASYSIIMHVYTL